MAAIGVNVFGKPITHGNRNQRAQATAKNRNDDGKLDQATHHFEGAAAEGVNEDLSSWTAVLLHNATDDHMPFVTLHNWDGHVAGLHPKVIQKEAWASLDHIGEPEQDGGSIGAIVYRIPGSVDAMIAWYNPNQGKKTWYNPNKTVYCEMNDLGYFNHCDWNEIYHSLRDSGTEHHASMEGFTVKVSINENAKMKAKFYLSV